MTVGAAVVKTGAAVVTAGAAVVTAGAGGVRPRACCHPPTLTGLCTN